MQNFLYFLVFVAFNLDVASCIRSKKRKKTRSRCVILPVWKAELGCSSIQIDSSQIWTLGGPGKLTHLMLRRYPVLFQRFWRDQLKNEKFKEFLNRLGGGYCCWTTSWWASKAPPPIQPMHTKWPLWQVGEMRSRSMATPGKNALGFPPFPVPVTPLKLLPRLL